MATSVDKDAVNTMSYSILIEGKAAPSTFLLSTLYIRHEINKISYAKLELSDVSALDNKFEIANDTLLSIGNKIEIKLGYSQSGKTVFKGIITAQGLKLSHSKSLISIECRDEAIKLTSGRKSAIFEEVKDSEVISKLAKAAGLSTNIEATKTKHKEVVQHYCSDWDFIMMRAEINGLLMITDQGKLVGKKIEPSGQGSIEVTYGVNMYRFEADVNAENQYKSVTSVAWDVANQKVLTASSKTVKDVSTGAAKTAKLSEVVNGSEYILQSAINMPTDALESWATAKHLRSSISKIKGMVEFAGNAGVLPASYLKISGLSKAFNGNAFVGAVEHSVEDSTWKTTAYLGTNFEWYSEETSLVEPPSASGLVAPFKGLSIGIVKQLDEDKDGQYRIKVSFPTLQKDNLAVWARLSNFYATKEAGSFFYPEIGDEVVVGFLNEDPQHPVILGMLFSSKNKTPFPPEKENKIKALVTKSKLTIQFDDKDKIIEIHTPAKNSIKIDDKEGQILIVDKNKNKLLLSKDGVSIETEKDFIVKAKGKITMEATSDIALKATGDLKGEGMNVALEGKTKFAAKGAMAEVNGSGQTTIKGGMVMIN